MIIQDNDISPYQLGIIFSIGSYTGNRLVFRYKHRYFVEKIRELTGNAIYEQKSNTNIQYVLKTKAIDVVSLKRIGWSGRDSEQRYLPMLDDYRNFLRAYMEIHSSLDYSTRYMRHDKSQRFKALRLRIYGNTTLISGINEILSQNADVKIKTVQSLKNGKSSLLSYTNILEIKQIFDYISGDPHYSDYWDDIYVKLDKPILYQ